jgi:hypothetical protein
MEQEFELPVMYKESELSFHARLLNYGYSYKLEVEIEGVKVLFEPDEERNWRALLSYEDLMANKKISMGLLEAITFSIDKNLK